MVKETEIFKASLDERLAAKGLLKIESDLFVKDVRRIIKDFTRMNLETINGQLKLLGWIDVSGDLNEIIFSKPTILH